MSVVLVILDSPYIIAMMFSSIIALILALYVGKRRSAPGSFYFSLVMLMAAVWTFMSGLEISVVGLSAKMICSQLSYIAVVSFSPLFLLFTLDYSGKRAWLAKKPMLLLWVIPLATLMLVFTNQWHGLIWPTISINEDSPGTMAIYGHGPAYFIHAIYSYLLVVTGILVMIAKSPGSSRKQRRHTVSLVAGIIIMIAISLLVMSNIRVLKDLDVLPFMVALVGVIFSWRIFRHHLFDIKPAAYEKLIADMADGVLVIDGRDVVIEANTAALELIGHSNNLIGQPLKEALAPWPSLEQCLIDGRVTTIEVHPEGRSYTMWLDTRISPLHDRNGKPAGRLIVFHDITERKRTEEALRQAYDELIQSNEALHKEIADRRNAEEQALDTLREKEVLLKEIHHRVKNNLQIISSLLSLQSGNIGTENPVQIFRESQDRIRSMALIHEKLYQSRDISRIDLAEYVRSLTAYLSHSYALGQGVDITIDIEGVSLGIDTAIPCGLIINELVSNALKYAFSDGRPGGLRVGLVHDGNRYVLTVSDNGVGFPPGLDFRDTPSLGLQLVNTLVGQLDGTIELDTTHGTAFRIVFREINSGFVRPAASGTIPHTDDR